MTTKDKWTDPLEKEVADIGLDVLADMLLTVSPTIANMIERQARMESILILAEQLDILPKGMNQLGDLVLERLRNDKEVSALKEITNRRSIIPLEYAQKVNKARTEIEKNDREIGKMIRCLISNG